MAVVFGWDESQVQSLLRSCDDDESASIIQKHFQPGTHLLEAGCGAGRWLRYFQDRHYIMTGLEINPEAVAMVKRIWPDLDIQQGDCESSPFPDNHFDGALSFGVIEHWTEGPQKPLRDLIRVLKPGGKAYIAVPCHNTVRKIRRAFWLDEIFQAPRALAVRLLKGKSQPCNRFSPHKLFPVNPPWGKFFEYRMSPSAFRHEVEQAGFQILDHFPLGHMDGIYHDLNLMFMLIRWKDWKFKPTLAARWLNKLLSRWPFTHAHMQAVVAKKPQ